MPDRARPVHGLYHRPMVDDGTGRTLNWRAFWKTLAIWTALAVVAGVLAYVALDSVGYAIGALVGGLVISVLALFDKLTPRKSRG